jgi:hypothetical protein
MMTNDRLEWHLDNWRDWMQRTDSNRLGYPTKSACMSSGGASGEDEFDVMCEECDSRCADILDKIIDSISQPQRTAINHAWLKVAHHYPTQDLDYVEALESISRLADKRGLV